MAVTQYLEPIAWLKPKALVLACTHYPLLRPAIDRVLGPDVALIDPAVATADYVAKTIGHAGVLRGPTEAGKLLCYVSDNPQFFQTIGQRFLGEPIPGVVCLRPKDLSRAVPMASVRSKRAAAV
jgi:glutamate racemase